MSRTPGPLRAQSIGRARCNGVDVGEALHPVAQNERRHFPSRIVATTAVPEIAGRSSALPKASASDPFHTSTPFDRLCHGQPGRPHPTTAANWRQDMAPVPRARAGFSPWKSAQIKDTRTRRNFEIEDEGVSDAETHALLSRLVDKDFSLERAPSQPPV